MAEAFKLYKLIILYMLDKVHKCSYMLESMQYKNRLHIWRRL